ncbi:MAG: DUF2147 domain-containing protein [Pseudobdellovibrionaceae bacterium]
MRNILLSLTFLFVMPAFAKEFSPVGLWLVGSGKAKVEIVDTGGTLEGKIVWLKEPNDEKGQPKLDKNNPDKVLQTQTVLGMPLVKNFKRDEENKWAGGTVYDAESGKTYKGKITVKDKDTLDLRGYVGITLFGRTDTWKRTTLDLPAPPPAPESPSAAPITKMPKGSKK